jgi:hypothetical protein
MIYSVRAFALFLLMLNCCNLSAQNKEYFKDFDYTRMQGIDTLKDLSKMPAFFVICSYDATGNIEQIETSQKVSWQHTPPDIYSSRIITKDGRKLIGAGEGKMRDGYQRSLFQKQVYWADTMLVTHDTIIIKKRIEKKKTENYLTIQIFISKSPDSILCNLYNFSYETKEAYLNSPYASITDFEHWPDPVSQYGFAAKGILNTHTDPLLKWNITRHDLFRNPIDLTKDRFADMPGIPVSLFWLINTAIL